MKIIIIHIALLFCLLGIIPGSYGQETRVSGTIKTHPWINLPVVISTDMKGGLQSLGSLNLTTTPLTVLNTTVPEFKREIGMVVSVMDAGLANQSRYFAYVSSNNWLEVFVINSWEAGHSYLSGDYIAFEKNFYVANKAFTSDATSFATDAANWNNAGGANAKYLATELKMDNQTLNKVAITDAIVIPADVDKTIATVGFIKSISGNSTFDADKIVTRTGLTGITGTNFATTTVTDFLNKVFFPVLSPMTTSFRYNTNTTNGQFSYQDENTTSKVVTDHPGTVSFPYSAWNALTDLVFNYTITKRDAASNITKVELFKGGVSQGLFTDGSLTGTFSLLRTLFSNIDVTQNIPLTLTVTDNASNVVNLILNTSFSLANGVTLNSTRISDTSTGTALITAEGGGTAGNPYLIERIGSDLVKYFIWAIVPNDDAGAVTNINFSGAPLLTSITGSNITQTSITPVILSNSDVTTVFRIGASAKGSVANDVSTASYSAYYQMQDRLYCGFLASNLAPTGTEIKALQQSSLLTTNYTSTNGVTLTNAGSSAFFAWAIPTYVDGSLAAPAFSKTVYYYATGQWFTNTNTTVHYVKVSVGSTSSWYWVCIYNASTGNGSSVQVKFN